jgi:3-dehydroquinate synthase
LTRFDLRLRHPSGVTPVLVGDGVLDTQAGELQDWVSRRKVFVISSPRVLKLHAEVLRPLSGQASDWVVLEVPDGEKAKSLGVAEDLWGRMLEAGGKRDSRVIAFGGGSVGDLAGFVAGAYMRGLEYVQVPTTLLAQVDAAIGGKTAINLQRAKNSVGLFHHPQRVVADTRLLRTLPAAEVRSGLMEVLKMAILADPELFAWLEKDLDRLLSADSAGLAPVVAAAASAKIDIVERDPTEQNERMLLNLGHTLGHALEASLGYRFLRHGEAVGYGILFAVRLASSRDLQVEPADRIRQLVGRFQLPKIPPLEVDSLIRLMGRDKKVSEGGWRWVLPREIGACEVVSDLNSEAVEQELTAFVKEPHIIS